METFNTVINTINGIIWSNALVILCLCAGIFFSIRMKFPQFRLFREMGRLIVAKPDTDKGITPFQSFAATVGSPGRYGKCSRGCDGDLLRRSGCCVLDVGDCTDRSRLRIFRDCSGTGLQENP